MRMRWTALLALTLAAVACDDAGEPPLVAEDIMLIHEMSDQIVIGLEHYVSSQGIRRAQLHTQPVGDLESLELIGLARRGGA